MKGLSILVCAVAFAVAASIAAAVAPTDLPVLPSNDVNPPSLKSGATYQASQFPIALRVTIPDGSWLGGQGSIKTQKRGSFGWVEFLQSPPDKPLGAISMITSYDATPSVPATVARLQTGGSGAIFDAPKAVRLAGFYGREFDGRVVAKHHVFVPFTPASHEARFHPDAYRFDQGEVFRIVVLNVRGKTVVLLLENVALPVDQFATFLASAGRLLGSLRFLP